ncbi:MAG TPA: pilin [Steroidobacteraceae bacterium]|nr:pilin [Steroidobacteraceae bacterium]
MNTHVKQLARTQRGITLIEIMIVTTIIGILAAVALGQYQNYAIRGKVSEGISLVAGAKVAVAEGFQANGMAGVQAVSNSWTFTATKYVSNVNISPVDGSIEVIFSNTVAQIAGDIVTLTPQVQVGGNYQLLSAVGANTGSVDWACASTSNAMATSLNMAVTTQYAATLPSIYAPTQCK